MARRTHGEDPRRVAGRRDTAGLRTAVAVETQVARSRDDDDAGFGRATSGQRQRIVPVRLEDTRGDREVDDPNVVGVPDRDRVVDRRDDIADVALTIAVEDLEAEELRAWGDADAASAGIVSAARDDAGHVRAVAVVIRLHLVEPEV